MYDTYENAEGLGIAIVIGKFRYVFNMFIRADGTIVQDGIENYLFRIFKFSSITARTLFQARGIDTLNIWEWLITDVEKIKQKDGKRK